jgi:hypothetical protein
MCQSKSDTTVSRATRNRSSDFLCSYVLSQILSIDTNDREEVVDRIRKYLTEIGEEARKGAIPIDKFIINKVRASPLPHRVQKI